MEEIVGLGNASDLWRGWIGQGSLHLSLLGGAGRPAAAAQTRPHFSTKETKRATRASGCRSGWTTWTRCTSSASPPGWRSYVRQPTCRGTYARCTFDIRMGTCSGSAGDSSLKGRTGCPAGTVRGIEIVLLLAPHPASLGCPCKRPAWSIVVTGLAFCK